jgi:DNA-binding response OmpR family regulator
MELIINPRKKILVLDKNSRMSPVIDEIMYYGDFEIYTTFDPDDVLTRAVGIIPDLIVLDYLLLDEDCISICRDLKQESALNDVPVIVITGYQSKKAFSKAYECDALFVKPLDMNILASRIDLLMAS